MKESTHPYKVAVRSKLTLEEGKLSFKPFGPEEVFTQAAKEHGGKNFSCDTDQYIQEPLRFEFQTEANRTAFIKNTTQLSQEGTLPELTFKEF